MGNGTQVAVIERNLAGWRQLMSRGEMDLNKLTLQTIFIALKLSSKIVAQGIKRGKKL